jgi:hypothetical protein
MHHAECCYAVILSVVMLNYVVLNAPNLNAFMLIVAGSGNDCQNFMAYYLT